MRKKHTHGRVAGAACLLPILAILMSGCALLPATVTTAAGTTVSTTASETTPGETPAVTTARPVEITTAKAEDTTAASVAETTALSAAATTETVGDVANTTEPAIATTTASTTETTEKQTAFLPLDAPRLEAEHVSAAAGEKGVLLRVSLKNDPGFVTLGFTVAFDSDAMRMTGDQRNGEYARAHQLNLVSGGIIDGSKCNFLWYGTAACSPSAEGGAVLILSFDIDADTASGVYPITLSYFSGAPASTDGKTETPVGMISGSITVF